MPSIPVLNYLVCNWNKEFYICVHSLELGALEPISVRTESEFSCFVLLRHIDSTEINGRW